MTLSADISRLLADDKLVEATEIAKTHVKNAPSDKAARHFYIDLLIIAGAFEKADAQCNLASTFAPEDSIGFSILRNQLRAMAARQAWFETNAIPDFPGEPTVLDQLAIKANLAASSGDIAAATQALEDLDAQRGAISLSLNGQPSTEIRDLDDRIPHALEALTDGGRYLWVNFDRIQTLTIEPMSRPRDCAYRSAELVMKNGAIASVLLPAIYIGPYQDEALALGRATDWSDKANGLIQGSGQRCLLIGDDLIDFHSIKTLEFLSDQERQSALG